MDDWNDGYITEGLQTCHIIMGLIDEHLSEHPAVIKTNKQDDIQKALDLIMDTYQKIGGLDYGCQEGE